jgi:hypothetical protein
VITIALYDPNEIYSQSLQTLLEQIDDFRVIVVPSPPRDQGPLSNECCDILLIDNDLYHLIGSPKSGRLPIHPPSTLLLATYPDEVENNPDQHNAILKNAGKDEFEMRIRTIIRNRSKYLDP